jgi:RNA polymerase sigma factor (sigma-70 family)
MLEALRNRDNRKTWDEAWEKFRAIYQPKIRDAVRRANQRLDQASVEGLTQAILETLREKLPKFDYDRNRGPFRNWLEKVVRNEVRSFFRPDIPRPPEKPTGGDDHRQIVEELPDPDAIDVNAISTSVVDALHQNPRLRRMVLFRQALESVKQRLRNPERWEVFWAIKAEDRPAQEIAGGLGMQPGAVRKAVFDLERMLRKEMEGRLNRLLADARAGYPSEELANYAGQTVEELRRKRIKVMGPLQSELEKLLQGLADVATGKEMASAAADQLGISHIACAQAADRLGEFLEEELNERDAEELESSNQSSRPQA